ILDSERSDECIDFTMMCVFFFFVSVDNIWSSKNASIFDFSPSLKRKLNLVGTLGGQKLKIFNIFEMNREKPQKNEGKTGFFTQNQFTVDKKFLDDQKFKFLRNLSKTRKFANNFELSFENLVQGSPLIFLQISYKSVDKIFLTLSKYLHNFFLLAFKVQILTKIRQNHEYLQIILLTNHLRSESFFVYNDTISLHSNLIYPSPRSTPPLNVQQSGTHLPTFYFIETRTIIVIVQKVKYFNIFSHIIRHSLRVISHVQFISAISIMDDQKEFVNVNLNSSEFIISSQSIEQNKNSNFKNNEGLSITYGIDDNPPWYLCIFMALQHYLTMIGAIVSIPFILTPALCMKEDDPARGHIISTMIFVTAIVTFIQVTFGCRLPIVQGGTISFLVPTLAILKLPQWRCPSMASINEMSSYDQEELWKVRMRELSGAIAVSALFQVFLGYSGLIGKVVKYVTPLTIVPTVSLVGLSLFENAAESASKHWGISMGGIHLLANLTK
ncbi:hypothetical protein AGLY_015488, partial [Aphis glycines]